MSAMREVRRAHAARSRRGPQAKLGWRWLSVPPLQETMPCMVKEHHDGQEGARE